MRRSQSKNLLNNQSGMISILTVVLLTLVLVIITTGFLRIIIRNQRATVDVQLSTQAYYAAESGIEDAKKAIELRLQEIREGTGPNSKVLLNDDTCTPATAVSAGLPLWGNTGRLTTDGNVAYTCQTIDMTPTELVKDLNEGESWNTPLSVEAGTATQIRIKWTKADTDGSALSSIPIGSRNQLTPRDVWRSAGRMPLLRVQFVSVPGGVISTNAYYQNERTYFIAPTAGGSPSINTGLPGAVNDTNFNNDVQQANCTGGAGNVSCVVRLESGIAITPTSLARLNIRSIYRGSEVTVELLDAGGTPLETIGSQATVDVTGKASDVFKRLKVTIPIEKGQETFDYAAQSSEDICKLLRVGETSPSSVSSGC